MAISIWRRTLSKFEPLTPRVRLFDLPFLFEAIPVERFQLAPGAGADAVHAGQRHPRPELLAQRHEAVSADRPLRLPEDARGPRFRIQPSEVLVAQFEALSAEPVELAFRDLHDRLEGRHRAVTGEHLD